MPKTQVRRKKKSAAFDLVRVNDGMWRVMVARFPIASVFFHQGVKDRLPKGWVYVVGQFGEVAEMYWPRRCAGFAIPLDAARAAVRAFGRKRKAFAKAYGKA
jgi:hypothetical protein